MGLLKKLIFALLALVVIAAVIGLFLPSAYRVERSVVVNASPEEIHPLVNDLNQWPRWQPWDKADPTIVTTIGSRSVGVGASQSWTGDSGKGALTLTSSDAAKGVDWDLRFDDAFDAKAGLQYAPNSGQTAVTWYREGDAGWNLLARYFGLAMDTMVGSMFEDGLRSLKREAESGR